ncbi:alpha/beta fold hydrolase [Kocuria tytonis]|uniref:alpha/beta fold hydrolase n=1 Tax=Kocuria tytonis TaxID=2054280 RepID=UPI001F44CC07|nr:alpha/beta fold hydrolase [Kocuria tytonis]
MSPAPGTLWREHLRELAVMDAPIRVLDIGAGPAVVCCSGVASVLWDWVPVVELLRADHRVIVLDRPGYAPGQEVPETLPELDTEAARLLAVLDALDVPGPVTAVGHSFGAAVVEAAARLYPGRWGSLVLLDGSVPEAEGADPTHDAARTARRSRHRTHPAVRSRAIRSIWRLTGPAVSVALVPGRLRVARLVGGSVRRRCVLERPAGLPAGPRGLRGLHEPAP